MHICVCHIIIEKFFEFHNNFYAFISSFFMAAVLTVRTCILLHHVSLADYLIASIFLKTKPSKTMGRNTGRMKYSAFLFNLSCLHHSYSAISHHPIPSSSHTRMTNFPKFPLRFLKLKRVILVSSQAA